MKYQLEISNVTKSYGDLKANDSVSLSVEESSIHALLGENGAGKSTLVKIIYGSLMPDSGEMKWAGESFSPKNPSEAREQGIAMVFQHFSLFESLTVEENILLGLDRVGLNENFSEEITKYSKQYGLDINPQQVVGDLSVGARQRVEIIRCLIQNPKLLIMDEPTSVLTPQEVSDLFVTLRKLADDGCAILYISHKLEEVRQICSKATILRGGKLVENCIPQDHSQQELAEMMIGKKLIQLARSNIDIGSEIFSINNLSRKSDDMFGVDLKNISLSISKGSIVGIAGVAGNGQDELMELLIGEISSPADTLQFKGQSIGDLNSHERRQLSMFFIPEERLGHGAVPEMTLNENMLLSRPQNSDMTSYGVIDWKNVENLSQKVISDFDVQTPSANMLAKSLSGGNLQKFMVGRELIQNPELLIVAQPTWGVDAGSENNIHQALISLADQGSAILVISQDLDEILSLCEQIHVLSEGTLSDEVDMKKNGLEKISELMVGGEAND
jgi:simple sugar transport system ATP-binding protein|tara:strand:- start:3133 stop:4635 length:1503 start_codon:yes stop_codon:yes gene_type:complete